MERYAPPQHARPGARPHLMQIEKCQKEGISRTTSHAPNGNDAYISANVLSAWAMHLKTLLITALLLVAGGLFWWWAFDGGFIAVIVAIGLGAVLFLALRGNKSIKDELDAQVPDKDPGNKDS
ncbi:hypothetical protein [Variovorax paradoxus]|uniref:hypothetical protein n=1 Tax=Variovorax paradoxus TaxID=34073 RepID=UPI00278AD21A|nr:hypothetical protein [Variovorax paradoxus]MDQ0591270.1 hypothetical protein [Variovorax paradoxus]